MSDCEGKIGYKLCKKIYNIIKDDNQEFGLGYWTVLPGQESVPFNKKEYKQEYSWSYFKQLLLHCYSHRCDLVWC